MFCPDCGSENKNQASYCGACGASLQRPVTVHQSQTGTQQPQPSRQKKLALIIAAVMLLLAIAVATAAFFAFRGSAEPVPGPVVTDTSTGGGNKPDTETNRDSDYQYVSKVDSLIQRTMQLDTAIADAATRINSEAPDFSASLKSSIADLQKDAESVKKELAGLNVPAGFTAPHNSPAALAGYNVIRCDSLVRGTDAWGRGDHAYKDIFLEGQRAKESYQELLPVFQQQYQAAKSR